MWKKSAAVICALVAGGPAIADPSFDVESDKTFQSKSYYQSTGFKDCASSGCAARFPKIDGKDGVIIRRVSCFVTHKGPIVFAVFGVTKGDSAISPSVTLPAPPAAVLGEDRYTSINQEVLLRVPGGYTPVVSLFTNGAANVSLQCVISGEPG